MAYRNSRREFIRSSGIVAGSIMVAGCLGGESNEDGVDPNNFPQNDVDLIISWGPGGGYDTYSRAIAPYLEEEFPGDGNINPQNIQGSTGQIGLREIYEATPDGHTFGMINEDLIPLQVIQQPDFDIRNMPVFGNLAVDINSLWVAEHVDVETIDDLAEGIIEGDLRFATPSEGAQGATLGLVFGHLSGLYDAEDLADNLVIHEARGEAITTLQNENAEITGGSWPSLLPYHVDEGGPLEPFLIGTTDEELPSEDLEGAYTLNDLDIDTAQGIMDLTIDGRTFGGTPGTPDEIVELYRDAIQTVANDDDFIAEMNEIDRPINYVGPDEMEESIQNRFDLWEEHEDLLQLMYGDEA